MAHHVHGSHVTCPGCQRSVVPRRPGLFDRVLLVAAWVYLAAMILFCALLGPGLVMLAPVLIFVGGTIASYVQDRAFREPHCPRCEKILLDEPEGRPVPARIPAVDLV